METFIVDLCLFKDIDVVTLLGASCQMVKLLGLSGVQLSEIMNHGRWTRRHTSLPNYSGASAKAGF